MLLDILGIVIGFVAIVLVLSILVTAVVQTLSSVFRIRNHALKLGLAESQLVATVNALPLPAPTAGPGAATLVQLVAQAAQRPNIDKRVTWLETTEIIDPLVTAGMNVQAIAVVQQKLDRTRRVMEDKYLQWARGITIVAAFLIAAIFGVSTPELLERLQTDQTFRAKAEALGERLAKDAPPAEYATILQTPALRARVEFLEKHPEYTEALGSLPLEGHTVDFLVAAFETALDADPKRDELATEYRALLEKSLADQNEQARAAMRRSVADLGALGIAPLTDWSFYFPKDANGNRSIHVRHIIGVLFTAVLLSFGAPFWYKILKELVGLKDALRKKDEDKKEDKELPPPSSRPAPGVTAPAAPAAATAPVVSPAPAVAPSPAPPTPPTTPATSPIPTPSPGS